MDLTALITQLIGGAIGGLGGGKAIKDSDLGPYLNLLVVAFGVVGVGEFSGLFLGAAPAGGADIGALVAQLVGGGVGGAILQIVVGLIKNKMLAR
jgi:hypothetical protein